MERRMSDLLNVRDDLPASLLALDAAGLHAELGGPTLFHLQGGVILHCSCRY
jgi:hypothetical protein